MRFENILEKLRVKCPFPEVFADSEKEADRCYDTYRSKIVHIRADYDGRKWWNTVWPHHDELATPEIRKEVDDVYAALTNEWAFKDLSALVSYCKEHPDARVSETSKDEYNFYYEGELCCYWLRCITRFRDYNLYLHAFLKPGKEAAVGE